MIKTSPSNAGGVGSRHGWGTKTPHAFWPKKEPKNRSSSVTNSIKTLKVIHIKKKRKVILPTPLRENIHLNEILNYLNLIFNKNNKYQ